MVYYILILYTTFSGRYIYYNSFERKMLQRKEGNFARNSDSCFGTFGQTGQWAPMGGKTPGLFRQLAKKMIESAGK